MSTSSASVPVICRRLKVGSSLRICSVQPQACAAAMNSFAGGRDLALAWAGEEVEILRRPGREVLCRQRGAAGEEESLGRGQLEEHRRYL
jgi:hypothetical protein